MTADHLTVNDPGNWTGPDSLLGAIDDLVVHDVRLVHLEAMSDQTAHLAIYKQDGTELRFWLSARPETPMRLRPVLDMREEQ